MRKMSFDDTKSKTAAFVRGVKVSGGFSHFNVISRFKVQKRFPC